MVHSKAVFAQVASIPFVSSSLLWRGSLFTPFLSSNYFLSSNPVPPVTLLLAPTLSTPPSTLNSAAVVVCHQQAPTSTRYSNRTQIFLHYSNPTRKFLKNDRVASRMYFSLFRKIAASLLAKTILIDTALANNPPKEQEFHPQRIKCRSMSKRNNSSSKNILLRRVEFGNFSVVFESQIQLPNSPFKGKK